MKVIDVFNGDADGILSLLQLRLAKPKDSVLITGVKRDIALLQQIDVNQVNSATEITVLDISMAKNEKPLIDLCEQGAQVFYADHHLAPEIPAYSNLKAHIHLDADICTGLIINNQLKGQFQPWAIAAAFGDNLQNKAKQLAIKTGLTESQSLLLKEFGELTNYNGYGRSISDLHFAPDELFLELLPYESPFDCFNNSDVFAKLKQGYADDLANAQQGTVLVDNDIVKAIALKNDTGSHRISGSFANMLANESPDKAHLILTELDNNDYLVSLRAPLNNKQGAASVCSQFATGGGREAAAGINRLPQHQVEELIKVVAKQYR